MSTQEAFEKWLVDTRKVIIGTNDPYLTGLYRDYWEAWQACQAHNAKDIAELVEALEVMTPIYNQLAWIAVCWNDHNFDANSIYTKINTAFNEAGFKRGDGVEPVNNFVEKLEALIAKHKGQS